ncbi:MAG: FlgD immunoglobulin-like domain containing protein [bacterium]
MDNKQRTLYVSGVFILCLLSNSWSQSTHKPGAERFTPELRFLLNFDPDSCIEDLPAPSLLSEPRFTKGITNKICIQVPQAETLPFPPDTVRVPFVKTVIFDALIDSTWELAAPVSLTADTNHIETAIRLKNGRKYAYSVSLVLPICLIPCDQVSDNDDLDFHCSAYADTVWSVQDTEAPIVKNIRIPQLEATLIPGWWHHPEIDIEADLSDQAGVWQGFLFNKSAANAWEVIADTTYHGVLTDSGYVFPEESRVLFRQHFSDGFYRFRVEAKDATHTPESCFENFQLDGNGGEPQPDDLPQIEIRIDTTPPERVTLQCEQTLNSIKLSWTSSADLGEGIGLEGYFILRDGIRIDSVTAKQTTYDDTISNISEDVLFTYQVQPFDSLGNVQKQGGTSQCRFIGIPEITMVPEPQFSPGNVNQVCWRGSSKVNGYSVFIAEGCDFSKSFEIAVNDTCFTFTDLKESIPYCYWVKGVDLEQRVIYSDTVRSIQDATLPVIALLDVEDKIVLNKHNWITQRNVQLHITAEDKTPGEIRMVQVFMPDSQLELTVSSESINETIPLTLNLEECVTGAISVSVVDGAGNTSIEQTIAIVLDESPPQPIASLSCFQLNQINGIQLDWTESRDLPNCSGLAGYRILRDDVVIDTLGLHVSSYVDTLSAITPSSLFRYAVQPYDSLGQLQSLGQTSTCEYVGQAQIEVDSLPQFTPGQSTRICWTLSQSLVHAKVYIDEDCDSVADDSLAISNPFPAQHCQIFENLLDGQAYCYWVTGFDEQERVVQSNTVMSIQDQTAPVIEFLTIQDSDSVDGKIWVFERDIEINIKARDKAPGEIWRYQIIENGQEGEVTNFAFFSTEQNQPIPYTLLASGSQPRPVRLEVRIFDGANNRSSELGVDFIFQEGIPRMYAFPNPFNPMARDIVIRLAETAEDEVRIYDFFGNLVRTIVEKANRHDFVWDGRNGNGEMVANGGYICVGTRTRSTFKIGIMKKL